MQKSDTHPQPLRWQINLEFLIPPFNNSITNYVESYEKELSLEVWSDSEDV